MTDQMRLSDIDALPMEMTQAAIAQWVAAVVAATDHPVRRAEAWFCLIMGSDNFSAVFSRVIHRP